MVVSALQMASSTTSGDGVVHKETRKCSRRDTATTVTLSDEPSSSECEVEGFLDIVAKRVAEELLKESKTIGESVSPLDAEDISERVVAELMRHTVDKCSVSPMRESISSFQPEDLPDLSTNTDTDFSHDMSKSSITACGEDLWSPEFWSRDLDEIIEENIIQSKAIGDDFSEASNVSDITELPTDSTRLDDVHPFEATRFIPEKAPLAERKVRFGTIAVRFYGRIPGDNPACGLGPPLSIGWKFEELDPVSVSSFERVRMRQGRSKAFLLSRRARESILLSQGFTEAEIVQCVRQKNKSRAQREKSVANASMDQAMFNASRRVKAIFSRSK